MTLVVTTFLAILALFAALGVIAASVAALTGEISADQFVELLASIAPDG